ncbi:nitric oxide reductase activation protein NorD [Noviherbaspirillum pedocola]|uniref:VWA domain-containing protein n=1 Tax=Noviherbaspirillum pedocola TaxID=2801341 RepID=A0A934SZK1_9BURK|nr:VWA domain-containing protein [Noviherbaspirillum pedocola]MBK4738618.1 VWA domain-containing protein [Noviherbaspirillum pedocola]
MELLSDTLVAHMAALEARDSVASACLNDKLPSLARLLRDDAALAELVALCDQAAAAVPGLANDLIMRLETLLGLLDMAGLKRWVLTGMRLYPNHRERLAAYFRLEDPAAADGIRAEANGTCLEKVRDTLQYYLAGFGLDNVELKACRQSELNALPPRPAISDGVLLFPEHYLAIEGADCGDIYRAAAAHAMAHIFYSPRHQPAGKRKPLHLAVLSLIEDARVERLMARNWPGLHRLWGRFHLASGEAGELTAASLLARLSRILHDPTYADPNHWVNKGRELFDACGDRFEDGAPFHEVADILANDLGQMRVRFDPERYRVEPAYRDDNTFLWHFDEDRQDTPPQEMLARESVQMTPQQSGSQEAMAVNAIPPDNEQRLHYPEWDYRAEIERQDWVTLIMATPGAPGSVKGGMHSRTTRTGALNAANQVLDRSVRLRRQPEGDELDLDASVEWRISSRTRAAPDPRIYHRPGRRRQDASVLLLLDLSESTNDRVGGSFTSILDMEKRAAALAVECVDGVRDRIAVHGFASNGRNEVRYTRIKDFAEPFAESARHRLMGQQGALSTRMGAALRHAGACLASEQAGKKVLLLVTDGEPSDIDVYDSRYLIEDARYAVATLERQGIKPFCLTLDQRADAYVRTIFGAWNYLIVSDPVTLPAQVAQALVRAAAR